MLVHASESLFIPINSWQEITLRINQFFKFLIKFLRVWSYVLHAASFNMLLDLVPVFTIEAQSLQQEIVLLWRPPADLVFVLNLILVFLFCRTKRIRVFRLVVLTWLQTHVRVTSFSDALKDLKIRVVGRLGRLRFDLKYLAWRLQSTVYFARFLFHDLNLQCHFFSSNLF